MIRTDAGALLYRPIVQLKLLDQNVALARGRRSATHDI